MRTFIFLSCLSFLNVLPLFSEEENMTPRQIINSTIPDSPPSYSSTQLPATPDFPEDSDPCPPYFSYRPAIKKQAFYLGGEYLYWKLDEAGMNYAISNHDPLAIDPSNGNQVTSMVRNLKSIDFHYDSGVRGWIGYRIPHNFWEITGEYTFYYTSKEQYVTRTPLSNEHLVGTFPEFTHSTLRRASSRFNFHYHIARLQVARSFFVGETILLRPFFGAQGAWIGQNWAVTYTGQNGNQTFHQNNWDYQAGGMHLGLNSEWYIAYGFALFLNGTLSALYGSHHLLSTMDPDIFVGGTYQKITPSEHRVTQSLQLATGLNWGMVFDPIAFKFIIGYELNSWLNLNELYRVNLAGNGSGAPDNEKIPLLTNTSLNLQGFIIGFALEY